MAGTVAAERVEKLLLELMDADLVRVYHCADARYLFVPRFRQRLRFPNSRYPEPPNEINDLAIIKTDSSKSKDVLKTAEVKRSEEKNYLAQGFAQFWDAYPKKRSKGDAEKAWKSLSPGEPLIASILQAIDGAKTSEQWRRDDGQFIPYPASWLRAKGWEDVHSVQPVRRVAI